MKRICTIHLEYYINDTKKNDGAADVIYKQFQAQFKTQFPEAKLSCVFISQRLQEPVRQQQRNRRTQNNR